MCRIATGYPVAIPGTRHTPSSDIASENLKPECDAYVDAPHSRVLKWECKHFGSAYMIN